MYWKEKTQLAIVKDGGLFSGNKELDPIYSVSV